MKPQLCKAQVQNDEYFCACCGLRWETSDQDYIPNCKHGCVEPFESGGWGTPEFTSEAAREEIEKIAVRHKREGRVWDQKRRAKEVEGMFQDAEKAYSGSLSGRWAGVQEARKKDPGLLYKKGVKGFVDSITGSWGTLKYSKAREMYIEAMRKSPLKEVREMFQQISEEDEVMLLEGWSVLRRASVEAKEKAYVAHKKAKKFKRDAEIIHELVVGLEKLIDDSGIT